MPLSWKWRLALAVLAVVLWSHPGSAAKIERFKDSEGTLHISNSGEAEPAKPGEATTPTVAPVAPPPAPVPPVPSPPPQVEPPPPVEVPEGAPPAPEGEPPAAPPGDQSAVGRPAPNAVAGSAGPVARPLRPHGPRPGLGPGPQAR